MLHELQNVLLENKPIIFKSPRIKMRAFLLYAIKYQISFSFYILFRYTMSILIYWRLIMSVISDNFLKEAESKKVKFNGKIIEKPAKDREGNDIVSKQNVLQTALQISEDKVVPCAVVIHETDELEYVNYQMNYNRIGFVTDRNELPNILEKINELNAMRSGYYHFVVNPDGELHLRHLGIMGKDPIPAVNTFIHGGNILRLVMKELAELKGLDLSTRLD